MTESCGAGESQRTFYGYVTMRFLSSCFFCLDRAVCKRFYSIVKKKVDLKDLKACREFWPTSFYSVVSVDWGLLGFVYAQLS